jgi:hypothetical protein
MWVNSVEAMVRTGQTKAELDEAIANGVLAAKREGWQVLVELPDADRPAKAAPRKRRSS